MASDTETKKQMRQHEMEIEIDATVEQVWEAVSTSQGIASWFAPDCESGARRRRNASPWRGYRAWRPSRESKCGSRTSTYESWGPFGRRAAQRVDYYVEAEEAQRSCAWSIPVLSPLQV